MIDADGFRPNVGIILASPTGGLLWARRVGGQNAWQFPQGGINDTEDPEAALYRELREEVGLLPQHVTILGVTRGWLRYRLPARFVRHQEPVCVGQKQKWFLLAFNAQDDAIALNAAEPAEFDAWRWVSYWYPVNNVVSFKRDVYRRALKALSPLHVRYEEKQHKSARGGHQAC